MHRALALATAAAAWVAAWTAFPAALALAIAPLRRATWIGYASVTSAASARLGLAAPAGWLLVLVGPALLAALATFGLMALWRRLDRWGLAWAALRWLPRALPCTIAWAVCGVAACSAFAALLLAAAPAGMVAAVGSATMAGLWLAYRLLAAGVALRPEVVDAARPPRWWGPAWPGIAACTVAALALLATGALSTGDAFPWPAGRSAAIAVAIACLPLSIALGYALDLAWIGAWLRQPSARAVPRTIRDAVRIDRLGLLFALDLRIGWGVALALGWPMSIWLLESAFVLPQATAEVAAVGQPPAWMQLLFRLLALAAGWWWLAVMGGLLLALPAYSLVRGRMLWRSGIGAGDATQAIDAVCDRDGPVR